MNQAQDGKRSLFAVARREVCGMRARSTRSWPDRDMTTLVLDDQGHVLVTTDPRRPNVGSDRRDRSQWARLEILESNTLATLGSTLLDHYGFLKAQAAGRALIGTSDGHYFVDVTTPAAPAVRAFVPGSTTSAFTSEQLVLAQPSVLGWHFPADLQNLTVQ